MQHAQTAFLTSSSASLSSASAAASASSSSASSSAPTQVIANDPITEIRLLASLPVNLGQNLDQSA